jgi:hypothetical protein
MLLSNNQQMFLSPPPQGANTMISPADRQAIEDLKAQVQCTKKFSCVNNALSDLCKGIYHRELDIMECLEEEKPVCKFARSFGCTHVCLCPLRKLIAMNFDRWSVDETTVLRQARIANCR